MWPVFFHGAQGMILVCAKDSPEHKKHLEEIIKSTSETSAKLLSNTFVLENNFDNDDMEISKAAKPILPKFDCHQVNVYQNQDSVRKIFNKFVMKIFQFQ